MPITAQSPGLLAGEDVFLGRDIARHVAMAIDVIGCDVQPDGDVGAEGLQKLELIRRQFEDIDAALAERRKIERAAADVATDFASRAGLLEDVADQRRGRRLAVGAGDGDEACRRFGAGQQLDVADDLLAGRTRRRRYGMRRGQVARDARADDQRRRRAASRSSRRIGEADAGARSLPRAKPRCRPRRRIRRPPPSGRAPSPGRSARAPARRRTNP